MKITIISPLFAIAGVPLAQLRFAQCLASRGHHVELIFGRILPNYVLPDISAFKVINFACPNTRNMFFPLRRYFKTAAPDIVFSAEDHLNAIVILAAITSGSKLRISASSRVSPFDTYSTRLFSKRWILKQVMRALMWRADVLTCVSRDMVGQYREVFHKSKHTAVYNIVADPQFSTRALESVTHPWFKNKSYPILIAAGRLAPWKGFTDLIDAIALLKSDRIVRLLILGDGPLRGELQAKIDQCGLSNFIHLMGYVNNPLKYFSRADIFVLSSHVEGLPNVLVEAMMCGCTPVATNCPTGPSEVLDGGRFGYLVTPRDPRAIADGILKAIRSPISSELLIEAVRPFQEDAVISRHFGLLGLSDYINAVDNKYEDRP